MWTVQGFHVKDHDMRYLGGLVTRIACTIWELQNREMEVRNLYSIYSTESSLSKVT